MSETCIVIPCYNEARRLDHAELTRLAATPGLRLLTVNDGSRDATLAALEALAASCSGKLSVLDLPENVGKAEAVRAGLNAALGAGAAVVGYVDADLATPVDEVKRLRSELDTPGVSVVMGARVARAGSRIERKATRHISGRVFATVASLMLGQRFYDTQCGAKLFRDTPALREALSSPFSSRWAFDVELLGRLLSAAEPLPFSAFLEVPLQRWADAGGSKLSLASMLGAGFDLLRIGRGQRARLGK
jgi:glycosyltransferase involved in cell wall biosynthesis